MTILAGLVTTLAAPSLAARPSTPEYPIDRLVLLGVLAPEAIAPAGTHPPFHPVAGSAEYGESGARFGAARPGHVHAGQDVFAAAGTPLVSPTFGVVVEAGTDGSRGNHVAIYDQRRDRSYVFMHMISPAPVAEGQQVRPGQHVGAVGCTGSCWGDHLHFEIRLGRGTFGEAIDPLPFLQAWPSLGPATG